MTVSIVCPLECIHRDEPDFLEKHSTFVITLVGCLSALVGSVFSYILNSRCKTVKTCCFNCERDVIPAKDVVKQLNNKIEEVEVEVQ